MGDETLDRRLARPWTWLLLLHRVGRRTSQPDRLGSVFGDDSGFAGATNVVRAAGVVLEPSDVADVVAQAIADERFLILPHPEVADYEQRKAADRERWLAGMRKLQARVFGSR
jgi:hypothetical protein